MDDMPGRNIDRDIDRDQKKPVSTIFIWNLEIWKSLRNFLNSGLT